jgi:hypothetical protein
MALAGPDRTGPGTRRPGQPSGQGIAPTGAADQVPGLRLELVPLGPDRLTEMGAPRLTA